ncbi:MAG TPA: hybrid sensor histidine kinase/response regulator [Anaeromyxobacteraceae bacterium]|nr:hybrid sensor histidine kinase/response regulator [Anaeromyxobacteraceae bacterium]
MSPAVNMGPGWDEATMGQRVLCIDGDAPRRQQVRALLHAGGLSVEESGTGLEGLSRARSLTPDLVLVGTGLPDIEGLDLLARVKADRALRDVPLVALGRDAGEREVALAAGCDGFLARPIDPATFAEEVKAYLAGRRDRAGAEGGRAWLDELERRRTAFMHDLAHELSTPLTPLAGYLKILHSERIGPLSAQQRKVVESMASAVVKLTRIVDNLSDFALLRAGESAINPAAVDPEALVTQVVEDLKAPARDARLHLEVRAGAGPALLADPRKLRQALMNVVSNAIKFSPHGGEVLVEVTREAGLLRVSVYDQGPGVAASELEGIFEPFHHRVTVGEARPPGSGLGLPVARRIAEAHGGRIVVESPPHSQPAVGAHHFTGSRFIVEIPARPAQSPPSPSPAPARASGQG